MAVIKLYDIDEEELSSWAKKNCSSFVGWYIFENDPFALLDDDVDWAVRYEFEFTNEQEAMLFQLRWQGQ